MDELNADALLYLCADRFLPPAPPDAPAEKVHVVPGTQARVDHRALIIETYAVLLWDRRQLGEVVLQPTERGVQVWLDRGTLQARRWGTPTSTPLDPKTLRATEMVHGGDPSNGLSVLLNKAVRAGDSRQGPWPLVEVGVWSPMHRWNLDEERSDFCWLPSLIDLKRAGFIAEPRRGLFDRLRRGFREGGRRLSVDVTTAEWDPAHLGAARSRVEAFAHAWQGFRTAESSLYRSLTHDLQAAWDRPQESRALERDYTALDVARHAT